MAGSKKRPWRCMEEDEEGRERPREIKRWRPLILEVMGLAFLQRLLEMLEPIIRRVVREEVEKIIGISGPSNPRLPMVQNLRARFRLQFQNDVPQELYTCSKIMSKEGMLVKIAIFDTLLECLVTSVPWSSAKVKVVVLDGDFCANEEENWSKEAFRKHIVNPRKGKGPLLSGEVVIKLDQGVGHLTDITFTDNSSWTRSGKFRLGLKLNQNEDNNLGEGISRCFRVKEGRVKGNEKHHPPSLKDEIYYLEGIRKDGSIHKRLMGGGISTVQQLLRTISTDPEKLQSLLRNVEANKKGVSQGRWAETVKNARECPPGDELYFYKVIEQDAVLIFNSIYQLHGVYFGNHFYTTSGLSADQQVFVQNLKQKAFQNLENIQLFKPAMVGDISNSLQQAFTSSDQQISSFTRQQKHPLDGWTSQAFPNQTQYNNDIPCDQSWFQENHLLDGWTSQEFPYHTQCNSQVPNDQSWFHDPCAPRSMNCSQEFTFYQEASTSKFHLDPDIRQMNHRSQEDTDRFLEYRQHELVRRWIKLVTGIKFVIHIGKYLAIRRSGMWHFNIERFK